MSFHIDKVELKYSVISTDVSYNIKFPEINEPIFVFAGRSNVGKSSVINSIIGKKIAFVSKTPGKTKQINYYFIDSKYYFVDLPGYGYAAISKREVKNWKYLIEKFFSQRVNIKSTFLIIDIRRGLLELDRAMIDYLAEMNNEFLIILNKSDKVNNSEIDFRIRSILSEIKYNNLIILPFSAKTGFGKKEIYSYIKKQLGI